MSCRPCNWSNAISPNDRRRRSEHVRRCWALRVGEFEPILQLHYNSPVGNMYAWIPIQAVTMGASSVSTVILPLPLGRDVEADETVENVKMLSLSDTQGSERNLLIRPNNMIAITALRVPQVRQSGCCWLESVT